MTVEVGTDNLTCCLIPEPINQMIRSLSFVPHELKIRPVECIGVKAWHLFPDDVTRMIPCFEESIGLLAA